MATVLDVSNLRLKDETLLTIQRANVNGWQGFVQVDGVTYNWMGAHPGPDLVEQTAFTYTSTRSTFTFNVADKVKMVVEFLSPVFPDDLMRQSLTSSYVEVSVSSSDGAEHDVQIYADMSGGELSKIPIVRPDAKERIEHASGDLAAIIEWEHGSDDGVLYHKFYRQSQEPFIDVNEQASWGNWYWAIGDAVSVLVFRRMGMADCIGWRDGRDWRRHCRPRPVHLQRRAYRNH